MYGRSFRKAAGMFALVVRFDVRDDPAAERFDELTAAVVRAISEHEPGTLVYATHRVEDEPLARVFYEVYQDRDAFEFHQAAQHVVDFHAQKDPLVVGRRVEFLSPRQAKGLGRF
jgi:quinol monooxygenase YgiN